jgi:hypothetical protein
MGIPNASTGRARKATTMEICIFRSIGKPMRELIGYWLPAPVEKQWE